MKNDIVPYWSYQKKSEFQACNSHYIHHIETGQLIPKQIEVTETVPDRTGKAVSEIESDAVAVQDSIQNNGELEIENVENSELMAEGAETTINVPFDTTEGLVKYVLSHVGDSSKRRAEVA